MSNAELERIAAMPTMEAFHKLSDREPRLLSLEEEARQGKLGSLPDMGALAELAESMVQLSPGPGQHSAWKSLVPELAELWGDVRMVESNLESKVVRLVGPDANGDDEILRSILAYNIVISYLRSLLPQSQRPIPPFFAEPE